MTIAKGPLTLRFNSLSAQRALDLINQADAMAWGNIFSERDVARQRVLDLQKERESWGNEFSAVVMAKAERDEWKDRYQRADRVSTLAEEERDRFHTALLISQANEARLRGALKHYDTKPEWPVGYVGQTIDRGKVAREALAHPPSDAVKVLEEVRDGIEDALEALVTQHADLASFYEVGCVPTANEVQLSFNAQARARSTLTAINRLLGREVP